MTVLSVVQQACPLIGLMVPDEVYASTDLAMIEMREVVEDVALGIADAYDWKGLAAVATYTGDGSAEAFNLPSDYDKMLKKAQVWSTSLETPLSHISDLDEWLGLDIQSFDFVVNAWTLIGDQINIKPAMASGITASHYYKSNHLVVDAASSTKVTFTADTDAFRLDDRMLKLGIIARWRENKGLAYTEDLDRFEDCKSKLMSADKGSRVLRVGRQRSPRGVVQAYPQSITP